jgi:hypothetical protein
MKMGVIELDHVKDFEIDVGEELEKGNQKRN